MLRLLCLLAAKSSVLVTSLVLGIGALNVQLAKAATVVTFDDLVGQGLVPNGYGGINWNGNWTYYGFAQPPYTPASPPNRVYDFVPSASFNFITPAVFNGAYFSGFSSATVQFQLFNGATLVGTSGVLAPSATPTFLSSGYNGLVTQIDVNSPRPDFFVMDNVTYNGSLTPTPLPAALPLFAGGLGVLGLLGWRKKRKGAIA
jgi:hypothetical protein